MKKLRKNKEKEDDFFGLNKSQGIDIDEGTKQELVEHLIQMGMPLIPKSKTKFGRWLHKVKLTWRLRFAITSLIINNMRKNRKNRKKIMK